MKNHTHFSRENWLRNIMMKKKFSIHKFNQQCLLAIKVQWRVIKSTVVKIIILSSSPLTFFFSFIYLFVMRRCERTSFTHSKINIRSGTHDNLIATYYETTPMQRAYTSENKIEFPSNELNRQCNKNFSDLLKVQLHKKNGCKCCLFTFWFQYKTMCTIVLSSHINLYKNELSTKKNVYINLCGKEERIVQNVLLFISAYRNGISFIINCICWESEICLKMSLFCDNISFLIDYMVAIFLPIISDRITKP